MFDLLQQRLTHWFLGSNPPSPNEGGHAHRFVGEATTPELDRLRRLNPPLEMKVNDVTEYLRVEVGGKWFCIPYEVVQGYLEVLRTGIFAGGVGEEGQQFIDRDPTFFPAVLSLLGKRFCWSDIGVGLGRVGHEGNSTYYYTYRAYILVYSTCVQKSFVQLQAYLWGGGDMQHYAFLTPAQRLGTTVTPTRQDV